jgi:hypothetical protein
MDDPFTAFAVKGGPSLSSFVLPPQAGGSDAHRFTVPASSLMPANGGVMIGSTPPSHLAHFSLTAPPGAIASFSGDRLVSVGSSVGAGGGAGSAGGGAGNDGGAGGGGGDNGEGFVIGAGAGRHGGLGSGFSYGFGTGAGSLPGSLLSTPTGAHPQIVFPSMPMPSDGGRRSGLHEGGSSRGAPSRAASAASAATPPDLAALAFMPQQYDPAPHLAAALGFSSAPQAASAYADAFGPAGPSQVSSSFVDAVSAAGAATAIGQRTSAGAIAPLVSVVGAVVGVRAGAGVGAVPSGGVGPFSDFVMPRLSFNPGESNSSSDFVVPARARGEQRHSAPTELSSSDIAPRHVFPPASSASPLEAVGAGVGVGVAAGARAGAGTAPGSGGSAGLKSGGASSADAFALLTNTSISSGLTSFSIAMGGHGSSPAASPPAVSLESPAARHAFAPAK